MNSRGHKVLENGCEIIGVEVGIMQTEIPCKPEAWLYWMEGQSITSERAWRFGTKQQAIQQINAWLELIGLALNGNEIVEF